MEADACHQDPPNPPYQTDPYAQSLNQPEQSTFPPPSVATSETLDRHGERVRRAAGEKASPLGIDPCGWQGGAEQGEQASFQAGKWSAPAGSWPSADIPLWTCYLPLLVAWSYVVPCGWHC